MKLRALTNVRPKKDLGTQVILAPTQGGFKVTPDAAKLLKVGAGDYCGVVVDDETGKGYVFKGGEDTLGGKLASSNKGGGGILNFSAAAGWNELKGDTDYNTHYNVIETPVDEAELEGTPFEGFVLYPLEFVEKVEKQAKTKSEDSEKGSTPSDEKTLASSSDEAVSSSDFSDI